MKEKRYSISHVQQMINISPAELQKMLKKNARVLHLFKEEKENGKKEVFLDEESQGHAMLSDFIGKPISLKAEPSYLQEQYDIVLL